MSVCWLLFHREKRQSTDHRMLLFHCLIINKADKILRFVCDVIESLEFHCRQILLYPVGSARF